jgi:hypothetical protein
MFRFDDRAALPGERIGAWMAPTLICHAAEDTLQPYHNAVFAAAAIPEANLMRFERGGHLLMAVEQAMIGTAIQKQILDHASNQISLRMMREYGDQGSPNSRRPLVCGAHRCYRLTVGP